MHTIGFVEYGPDVEIYYQPSKDNIKASSQHTCFGRVISGVDDLHRLQATGDVDPKMRLRIIQTRIFKKDHIIKSNTQEEL